MAFTPGTGLWGWLNKHSRTLAFYKLTNMQGGDATTGQASDPQGTAYAGVIVLVDPTTGLPYKASPGGAGTASSPYQGTPLGYQQIGSATLAAATLLTVPAGATYAVIQAETEGSRWRDDGSAPTATVGMTLAAGEELAYSGSLAALQFIRQAAGAILNINYYK